MEALSPNRKEVNSGTQGILQYKALTTAIRREFFESIFIPQFRGAVQQFDGRAKDSTNF
jgi:hypothetical protein